MNPLSIGEKILFFRKRAGISQLQLELPIGCSFGSISRIENNLVNPTKEKILKIAKVLDLAQNEILWLLDLNPDPFNSIDLVSSSDLTSIFNKISYEIFTLSLPNQKIYEGKEELTNFYNEVLSANSIFYSFSDLDSYFDTFPDNELIWQNAYKQNINRREYNLALDSSFTRDLYNRNKDIEGYNLKLISRHKNEKSFNLSEYIILGNKIACIQFIGKKPIAKTVFSPSLASSLIGLHKFVWGLLPN